MSKGSQIKNIVFDFGGVLLDIDYHRTYAAMSEILHKDFDPKKLPEHVLKMFYEFETGHTNTETFLWNLQRLSDNNVPHGKQIIDAWNAMLIGWDTSKFDLLLSLKKRYNIYLLSNTNEIHLNWVTNDLKNNYGIEDFDLRFFHKTYYSHLIGMRKPDQEIYSFVANDADIIGEETIFIDDILENIFGAQAVGWHTYHHNPNDNLAEILDGRLGLETGL